MPKIFLWHYDLLCSSHNFVRCDTVKVAIEIKLNIKINSLKESSITQIKKYRNPKAKREDILLVNKWKKEKKL